MGMFSEIHNESNAQDLEKVLVAGIDEYEQKLGTEYEQEGLALIEFLKKHVYPLYDSALGEAWRTKVPPIQKRVDDFFDPM